MKVNHYNSHLSPHKPLIEMEYHQIFRSQCQNWYSWSKCTWLFTWRKTSMFVNKCFDWLSGRENLVSMLYPWQEVFNGQKWLDVSKYGGYGEMAQKVIEGRQWHMTAFAFEIEVAQNSNHFASNSISLRVCHVSLTSFDDFLSHLTIPPVYR